MEGEEEKGDGGNCFDAGESAVIDNRVSPRAPSKSVQSEGDTESVWRMTFTTNVSSRTPALVTTSREAHPVVTIVLLVSRPRPRMRANVISMTKNA